MKWMIFYLVTVLAAGCVSKSKVCELRPEKVRSEAALHMNVINAVGFWDHHETEEWAKSGFFEGYLYAREVAGCAPETVE